MMFFGWLAGWVGDFLLKIYRYSEKVGFDVFLVGEVFAIRTWEKIWKRWCSRSLKVIGSKH